MLPHTPKTLASHYVREREGRRRGSNDDGNGREGDRRQRRDLDRILLKCVRGREVGAMLATAVRVAASDARPVGMSPEEEAATRERTNRPGAVEVEAEYLKP